MRRHLLAALITVAFAAVAAYAVTRWQAASAPSVSRLQDAAWLAQKLALTPDQVRQVEELQKLYATDLAECCSRHCTARMELGSRFFSEEAGAERERALVDDMARAQAESEMATLNHIRAVHTILTPRQRAAYEKMVTKCLCAACPNCSHT